MALNGEQLAQALRQVSLIQQQLSQTDSSSPINGISEQLGSLSRFTELPNMSRLGDSSSIAPLLEQMNNMTNSPSGPSGPPDMEQVLNSLNDLTNS